MATHDLYDIVDLTASFATSSGAANPTAMRFRVLKPAIVNNLAVPFSSGILTTYTTGSTAVTNPATGSYLLQLQVDRADRFEQTLWRWSAESSGVAVAGGEGSFYVNPSRCST